MAEIEKVRASSLEHMLEEHGELRTLVAGLNEFLKRPPPEPGVDECACWAGERSSPSDGPRPHLASRPSWGR